MTAYDSHPPMVTRAELIYILGRAGLPPSALGEYRLWELASFCGLHRIETWEDRDNREIVETKGEYWDETRPERMQKLAKVSAERKARAIERKKQKARS